MATAPHPKVVSECFTNERDGPSLHSSLPALIVNNTILQSIDYLQKVGIMSCLLHQSLEAEATAKRNNGPRTYLRASRFEGSNYPAIHKHNQLNRLGLCLVSFMQESTIVHQSPLSLVFMFTESQTAWKGNSYLRAKQGSAKATRMLMG